MRVRGRGEACVAGKVGSRPWSRLLDAAARTRHPRGAAPGRWASHLSRGGDRGTRYRTRRFRRGRIQQADPPQELLELLRMGILRRKELGLQLHLRKLGLVLGKDQGLGSELPAKYFVSKG